MPRFEFPLGFTWTKKGYPPSHLTWHLTGGPFKRKLIFQVKLHRCHGCGKGSNSKKRHAPILVRDPVLISQLRNPEPSPVFKKRATTRATGSPKISPQTKIEIPSRNGNREPGPFSGLEPLAH